MRVNSKPLLCLQTDVPRCVSARALACLCLCVCVRCSGNSVSIQGQTAAYFAGIRARAAALEPSAQTEVREN